MLEISLLEMKIEWSRYYYWSGIVNPMLLITNALYILMNGYMDKCKTQSYKHIPICVLYGHLYIYVQNMMRVSEYFHALSFAGCQFSFWRTQRQRWGHHSCFASIQLPYFTHQCILTTFSSPYISCQYLKWLDWLFLDSVICRYSESLYALLSIGGLCHLMCGSNNLATLWLALSGSARSNGVLNAGYICFQTMHRAYDAVFLKRHAYVSLSFYLFICDSYNWILMHISWEFFLKVQEG